MDGKKCCFSLLYELKITEDDIRCFIVNPIVSGYDAKPSTILLGLWNTYEEYSSVQFHEKRSVQTNLRIYHWADKTNIDKEHKLRSFLNMLQKKFTEQFVPVENLVYDESMITYYGKRECKQFFRSKPIRFGLKVSMKKAERGSYVSPLDNDHGVMFLKQMDNNVVSAASTCFGVRSVVT